MNVFAKSAVALGLVVALAGCSSTGGAGGAADGSSGSGSTSGADSYGARGDRRLAGSGLDGSGGRALGGPAASDEQRVVYFDYDSADIRDESRPVVEAHSAYLRENPNAAAILEGHADERGSPEYNIALGERRAEAVRRLMASMGVQARQLRVVSYGEERPSDPGHGESSYAQNRRVEIQY